MKNLNLKTKISMLIGGIVTISFVAAFSLVLKNLYDKSIVSVEVLVNEVSNSYVKEFRSTFENLENIANILESSIGNQIESSIKDRNLVVNMQKDILAKYPEIYGVTVAFEPNAYDGKDLEYVNTIEYGLNGLFIPYVTRAGDKYHVEVAYNSETDMTWYNEPKNTKSTYITEPTIYEVNGQQVSMASLAVPILDNQNRFLGVISIDYKLDTFQTIIEGIRPMGGSASLISKNGLYIANGIDKENIMKNILDLDDSWKDVLSQTSQGKEVSSYVNSSEEGKEVLRVAYPINIEGTSTNWAFVSDIPKENILEDFNNQLKTVIIIGIISLVAIIIFILFIVGYITRELGYVQTQLELVAAGNLSEEIDLNKNISNDEIGKMIKSTAKMQKALKDIIQAVTIESDNVAKAIDNVENNINELNNNMVDVSATTEELSASLEETAATTEEMNASTSEIEKSVEDMALKTQEGLNSAKEIYNRADKLKDSAVEAQKSADNVRKVIDEKLKTAIEKSKSVERINSLAEGILQITSQTNLLALNAAIEAARAGDVGKGFAVVAEEIRKLAESSKETVMEIQEITKNVLESVTSLKEGANDALQFIEVQVVPDYKNQVDTGEQYSKDAYMVENLIKDFSISSEELLKATQNIAVAVNEVTLAANEGAAGSTNIADKTTNIVSLTEKVLSKAEESKKSSEKLLDVISMFKL